MTQARGAAPRRLFLYAVLLAELWSLDACRTQRAPEQPSAAAEGGPGQSAAPVAAMHYTVDARRSQVLVLVYRDGPMGHLGHNHVIAVHDLSGGVALPGDPMRGSFDLDFPVESMSIDEPQLRAQQGADFESTLDEAAIAGTRDHMLGTALLNSRQFPRIHLQSEQIHGTPDALLARTRMTVRETTAMAEIPVTMQLADDELRVSGEFDLTHAQLGLTPYSVALGALRVAERMHVQYRLVATRDH